MQVRRRHIVRTVALIAGLALAVAAAGFWRLAQGPVDMAFLTPQVERVLSRPEDGYRIEMGSVAAVWAGWERLLRFQVSGARIVDLEGRPLVETDRLEFVLSASALAGGRIAPREIELFGVNAAMRRRSDGGIGLLAAAGADTTGEPEDVDLRGLFAMEPESAGFDLTRFGVRDATLTVDDDILGLKWSVPRLDLAFRDDAGGMAMEGAASVHVRDTRADIDFTAVLHGEAGGPTFSARLDGLRPEIVAHVHPSLALLGHVTTPLSGTVTIGLAPDYAVAALGAELQGTGGAIVDPADPERRVEVDGFVVSARVLDRLSRLEIEALEIKALGHTAQLSGGGSKQEGTFSVFTHLEDVPPALVMPLLPPRLAAATVSDMPLSGTVVWTFDTASGITALDAGLTMGAGELQLSGGEPGGVAVKGGDATFQVDLAAGQILVEKVSLDLNRGRIEASGRGKRKASGWGMHFEGDAAAISVGEVKRLWPHGVGSPGLRDWISSNLMRGRIDGAQITVEAGLTADSEPGLTISAVDGKLLFSGTAARYWSPLPAFEDISGSAVFDARSFILTLSGGSYRDIRVVGGELTFDGLDREEPPSTLAVDAEFEGPLNQVLEVLDRDPLGYAGYLGLDPAAVGGDAAFRLQVRLPLLDALAFDEIDLEASGSVVEARLPDALFDIDLEQARLDVQVDKQRLAVSGGGSLQWQPATFELESRFPDTDPLETVYGLRTVVDESGWQSLGFDLAPYVTGPVAIEAAGTDYRNGTSDYVVKAGLQKSGIHLQAVGWEKPAGEPAWLEATLRQAPEGPVEVVSLAAAGPNLEVAGRGRFDAVKGTLLEGSLDRLQIGERTDLAILRAAPAPDGAFSIQAQGAAIDLSRFLGDSGDETGGEDGLGRLSFQITTARAWVGGDTPLHDFAGLFWLDDGEITEAAGDARTANDRAVSFSYRPQADNGPVSVDAEDAGALIAALGWFDDMRGGELHFSAERTVGEGRGYDGQLRVEQFRIKDAPALARFLAAASLTGIGDALSSDAGLGFERLETPLRLRGRRVVIGPGRVFGTSLGATFRGEFDRDRRVVMLGGMLVPVYFANRVLGSIPLLGNLLTGGEGEGLFAASYEVTGPVDDPRTSVNPLTVLAPGFLRGLFGPLLGADGIDWDPDRDPSSDAEQ